MTHALVIGLMTFGGAFAIVVMFVAFKLVQWALVTLHARHLARTGAARIPSARLHRARRLGLAQGRNRWGPRRETAALTGNHDY